MYTSNKSYFGMQSHQMSIAGGSVASRLLDGTVTASPIEVRDLVPSDTKGMLETGNSGVDDDDADASDSDYNSFDESDNGGTAEESTAEREAREHERQLVLEAAGLIVKQDVKPPPRPARMKSKTSNERRAPPAAPRRASIISNSSFKDLPPVPELDPIDNATRLDDAFDRYESFRHTQGNVNRMSVASFETTPPSPTTTISSVAPSSSRDSEGRYSNLLHFLGRKTPVETERRTMPTISAPILNVTDGRSQSNSPAFGTVGALLRSFET